MKIIIVSLSLSIILNIYLFYSLQLSDKKAAFGIETQKKFGITHTGTKWRSGFLQFKCKLNKNGLLNKKYIYINTWAHFCSPCITEMPMLDSIAGLFKKNTIYSFVSEMNDKTANNYLKKYKYSIKNFIYANQMDSLIIGICNEKKIKSKNYPQQIIVDTLGNIVFYSEGAFENSEDASKLIAMLKKLN